MEKEKKPLVISHTPYAIGHQRAPSLLAADLASGKVAQAYIFVGPKGLRETALEFAKALNCVQAESKEQRAKSKTANPPESPFSKGGQKGDYSMLYACNTCVSCRKMEDKTHPDLFILDFDSQARMLEMNLTQTEKQKEYHIEAIRKLIHYSNLTPVESQWKIFVLDDAELLSLESANALLKSLEEPSSFSCWILLSKNFERILPTVRSRCRKILFHTPSPLTPSLSHKGRGDEKQLSGMEKIAEELLQGKSNPLEIVSMLLSESKGKARNQAETFLEILAQHYSLRMRENPNEKRAEDLTQILYALEDLRKNVNPQFVLDALLTELKPNV